MILRVANTGNKNADSFIVAFYISKKHKPKGDPIHEVALDGLKAGKRRNISLDYSSGKSLSGKYIVTDASQAFKITDHFKDENLISSLIRKNFACVFIFLFTYKVDIFGSRYWSEVPDISIKNQISCASQK